ncbi:MAG: hypothetical protein MJY62_02955 [Bacteroidales bacterium]|nr:hypothetical protein [Bacteroidales bacterium]
MSVSSYKSKKGVVRKAPYELYMAFCDMRHFREMLPEDKKSMVQADFDTVSVNVSGMNIGAKVLSRVPYSSIELVDYGSPVAFHVALHFDAAGSDTEFSIELDAELDMMMKMFVGPKIQGALDKMVDSLVDISNGKMPEGVDPSMMSGIDPSKFGF